MSGLFDQVVNYSPPLLTSGQVNYDGTWNAATNTPTLVSPPDALSKGDYYVVSAAGTQFGISFAVGDWIISNGTAWEKVDLTDAVSSVFGRTGAVVGDSTDYSAVGITNTAIGAANPSTGAFTSLSSSSTTTLNGTTIPASKTLVVTTDKLSALAATTSAELAGVISDETGSGSLVFANSPTLVTPALGTPSALVGTNITGTAAAFNINGTVGATTPSTVAATSVTALSDSGYQAVVGQLTSGDRVGISGQSSGSGTALVFFDNAQTTFRPAIFDASSHSLKISGVEKASVTSTGLQGAIGATTASTGAFTTVTASSTIAATGAVTGSNLSGTNTGDQTTISGNAGSATILQTGRNINGVSFNGSADITVTAAAGTLTGATLASGVTASSLTSLGTIGSLVATTADINGGTIDGTTVGATTPSTVTATTLTTTGDVGIGTASPTQRLQVSNSAGSTYALITNTGTGPSNLFLGAGNGVTQIISRDATTGAVPIAIILGTTEIGRISTTGLNSTAIGATTPSTGAFTTLSATGSVTSTSNGNNFVLKPASSGSVAYAQFVNSAGSEIGYVGYGTATTAGSTLSVVNELNGPVDILSNFALVGRFSSTGLAVTGALSSTTGANFATSSGNVVIGNATAAAKLHIQADFSGSFGATVRTTSNAADASFIQFVKDAGGSPNEVGKITYTNATNLTSYNTTSDARLKDNVRELTNSGNIIDALRPVLHDWKTGQKNIIGFVAQEVFAVFPQAVSKGDDDLKTVTQQWSMDASKLVPVLTAELKSLRARLAVLESK